MKQQGYFPIWLWKNGSLIKRRSPTMHDAVVGGNDVQKCMFLWTSEEFDHFSILLWILNNTNFKFFYVTYRLSRKMHLNMILNISYMSHSKVHNYIVDVFVEDTVSDNQDTVLRSWNQTNGGDIRFVSPANETDILSDLLTKGKYEINTRCYNYIHDVLWFVRLSIYGVVFCTWTCHFRISFNSCGLTILHLIRLMQMNLLLHMSVLWYSSARMPSQSKLYHHCWKIKLPMNIIMTKTPKYIFSKRRHFNMFFSFDFILTVMQDSISFTSFMRSVILPMHKLNLINLRKQHHKWNVSSIQKRKHISNYPIVFCWPSGIAITVCVLCGGGVRGPLYRVHTQDHARLSANQSPTKRHGLCGGLHCIVWGQKPWSEGNHFFAWRRYW